MEVHDSFYQIIDDRVRQRAREQGMIGYTTRGLAYSTLQGMAIHSGLGLISRCANRLNDLNRPKNGSKGPVLLTAHDAEWRTAFDAENNRTIITDRFFHPLVRELQRRDFEVCSASTAMAPYLGSLRIAKQKGDARFSRHYLVDGFIDGKSLVSHLDAEIHFEKIVKTIESDEILTRELARFGTEKAERLKEVLRFSFSKRFPDFVKRIDQAKLLLLKVKPSVVLIENELGFFQRSVIAAARSIGVSTIALQHGEISLTNPSYLYRKEDVCEASESPTCLPMPDLTLVYGPFYEDLLTKKSSFPPHRVISVGNMHFDSIVGVDKHRVGSELREELSIAPETRLVVWTTQSHAWDQEEIETASNAVRNAISRLSQVTLIVKQHPMETVGNKESLMRSLEPLGNRAVFAPKGHDIISLISAADVVITKDSTTGLEAVAARKPLIVMNLTGLEDKVDYVKEGAAVGVYRADDLTKAIDDALNGRSVFQELRDVFEKKYMLKLDGKTAKRIVDIVERLDSRGNGR
jgi:hypothetical protein